MIEIDSPLSLSNNIERGIKIDSPPDPLSKNLERGIKRGELKNFLNLSPSLKT